MSAGRGLLQASDGLPLARMQVAPRDLLGELRESSAPSVCSSVWSNLSSNMPCDGGAWAPTTGPLPR